MNHRLILIAVMVFPGEIYRAPRSWASVPITSSSIGTRSRGGHFAAFEQPELFTDEIRAAFKSPR